MEKEKTIAESLEELQKALEAGDYNKGPSPESENLYPEYKHLFSPEAQILLERKPAKSVLVMTSREVNGETFQIANLAQYFTGRARGRHNIPKVVEKIANIINTHVEKGHIIGFISPLACIQLCSRPSRPEYVAYSFPIFTPEGIQALEEAKYDVQSPEGGLSDVKFLDPLEERVGRIEHIFNISHMMVTAGLDKEGLIEQRKNLLLSILPTRTKYVGAEELPITSLSLGVILMFEHPYFKGDAQIELDFERIIWPGDTEGRLEQDGMLTGIRYIGNNRYDRPIVYQDAE